MSGEKKSTGAKGALIRTLRVNNLFFTFGAHREKGAVAFLLFIYGNNNKAGQSIRADVFFFCHKEKIERSAGGKAHRDQGDY